MGRARLTFKTKKMKTLLVCVALVASVLGDEMEAEAPKPVVLPGYYGYPYAHGLGNPLTYTLPAPVQYKYVPKEVPIEVKTFQPELVETGCKNSFGTPVPCRARREADEEAAEEAAAPLELPYYYAPGVYGAPVAHHAPLAYHHPVQYPIPEPVVKEIEVPTPV